MTDRTEASWTWLIHAAAGILALAAVGLSPEFMAEHFSADHQLAGFVVFRIQAIRLLAAASSLGMVAWRSLPAERREALLEGGERWMGHPAFHWAALAAVLAFLWSEKLIMEGEPNSEGVLTYGALRAARGEIPCRDFFTFVFPGGFYYMAAAYKVFGASLGTAHFFANILPKLLVTAVFYRTARALLRPPAALAVGAFTLLILSGNPDNAQILYDSLALLLVATTLPLLVGWLDTGKPGPLIGAALLAAAGGAVRQDFGLYILLVHVLWLAALRGRGEDPLPSRAGWKAYAVPYGVLGLAIASVMLITIPWESFTNCYLRGALGYMARTSTRGAGLVPFYGTLSGLGSMSLSQLAAHTLVYELALILAWGSLLAAGWTLWRPFWERRLERDDKVLLLLSIWTFVFMAHQFKGSANPLCAAGPASLLILVHLLARLRGAAPGGPGRWALCAGILVLAGHGAIRVFFRPVAPPEGSSWARVDRGEYLCRTESHARGLEDVIRRVRKLVPEGGKILTYDRRMVANHIIFYFLAERDSCTRYHELSIGVTPDPGTHARVLKDCPVDEVPVVVETTRPDAPTETVPASVTERHVHDNYKRGKRFDRYIIWKRKGGS